MGGRPGSTRREGRSNPEVVEEPGQDGLGPEVVLGDGTGRTAVAVVVGPGGFERGEGLVGRVEGEQALARGERTAEPRVLGDDGSAGGEVAGAPLAEPAAAEPDVLVLGHGELAPRRPDVVAVAPRVGREGVR